MKCYFDNTDNYSPNIYEQSGEATGKRYWVIPNGTNLKMELKKAGGIVESVGNINEQGCYFLDVNGDPVFWAGFNETAKHVLEFLPIAVIENIKSFKLRLIITADREGGKMIDGLRDCFKTTTDIIKKLGLPPKSVLITQGNKKIEQQYKEWIQINKEEELFEVMYVNHFAHIFYDKNLPKDPVIYESIKNANSYDFNSLNRVYRNHRASHLYFLAKNDLLDKGLVSANQITTNNIQPIQLLGLDISIDDFDKVLLDHYPKFVDGNWSQDNAANQYNIDIYKNSLVSFVTETQFEKDVVFLTEKIFKPIAIGHPIILLASAGTLNGLKELGFKIDYLGIDPSYNDIENHSERMIVTNKILKQWVDAPRSEKISRINQSLETIEHNFNFIRSKNFYSEGLCSILNKTKDYFNGLKKI